VFIKVIEMLFERQNREMSRAMEQFTAAITALQYGGSLWLKETALQN